VSEHQLDDADVDAIRQEPAGALMAQVVPVQVVCCSLARSTRAPGLLRFVS